MSGTLYERMGGTLAVEAVVESFYRKNFGDDRVSRFFENVDMDDLAVKMRSLLTVVFGGPNEYTGKTLRDAHAHLVARGLDDSHFDAVLENLRAALEEQNARPDLIPEVLKIAESARDHVLGRSPARPAESISEPLSPA